MRNHARTTPRKEKKSVRLPNSDVVRRNSFLDEIRHTGIDIVSQPHCSNCELLGLEAVGNYSV